MRYQDIMKKLIVQIMAGYIEFVYKTSKVRFIGHTEIFTQEDAEKVIALFWHGDSYCLYPALKGSSLYVVTTKDRRGDYISDVCKYFGYETIRVPDVSDGENNLSGLIRIIKREDDSNIAIAIDGPLGPYHVPKDFAIISALLSKRRIMPISFSAKREIELKRRWDHLKIPLPFNELKVIFKEPIEVLREDKKEQFASLKSQIRVIMETN